MLKAEIPRLISTPMKSLLSIAALVLLASFQACNVDEWTKFSLFYAGNTSIMADTNVDVWHEVLTNDIKVDFTEDLDLHGAKDKQVEEAVLERVELHIIEPLNSNFLFIDKVEVFLEAEGKQPVLLAKDEELYKKSDAVKIFVPLTDAFDMEESLRTSKMRYRVRYTKHKAIRRDHHIKVNLKVRVDSRRFGL